MLFYNVFASYEISEKQEKVLRKALKNVNLIKRTSISDVNKKQLVKEVNFER